MKAEAEEKRVVGGELRLDSLTNGKGVVRVDCCQRQGHIEEAEGEEANMLDRREPVTWIGGSGDPQQREQSTGAEARIRENEANMRLEHANSMASFTATFEAKIVPYHASAGTFFDRIRVRWPWP